MVEQEGEQPRPQAGRRRDGGSSVLLSLLLLESAPAILVLLLRAPRFLFLELPESGITMCHEHLHHEYTPMSSSPKTESIGIPNKSEQASLGRH